MEVLLGVPALPVVNGIALGLAIIGVFAIFENNRDKVLHVIDDLKTWRQ